MPNLLAAESSPYLLQHKDNPVDWYPWSAAALLKSRAEDKPIFLSIGYSACHWCHVMEHESFENPQIASFLNQHFVSIKVDREERPDLDQIYMQAVMAMNGHGGWPLSAFLTPDQDFFFGGTYWPPEATAHMPGFDRVLSSVLDAYHNKRDQVVQQAQHLTTLINSHPDQEHQEFDPELFHAAAQTLHNQFDSTFGGFGTAPKFPGPMDLSLLLSLYEHQKEHPESAWESPGPNDLLEMVEVTLQKMAQGGIFDHLAGGFARYSVDSRWLVPHFEKMLYDNALLTRVYNHAWRVTGNEYFREITNKTFDYLLRYMSDPAGGFYSTEDADSEGQEGKFYVWTLDEIVDILGDETGNRFCQLYDVTSSGNFEGDNILNLPLSLPAFAQENELDECDLANEMELARTRLLEVRDQRVRPGRDDKVITSWLALTIHSLAESAIAQGDDDYARAAENAGEFLWSQLTQEDGRLLHTWRNGTAKLAGYLDDYACLINAFVSLYRVRFQQKWVTRAIELQEAMIRHFYDEQTRAFFFTADDHEKLIARTQEFQDSAVPSGNAMAATALIRLGHLVGSPDMVNIGYQTAMGAVSLLKRATNAASQSLQAVFCFLHQRRSHVLICGTDAEENDRVISRLQKSIPPHLPLVVVSPESAGKPDPFASILNGKHALKNKPTLYVCDDFKCELPLAGIEKIETVLPQSG